MEKSLSPFVIPTVEDYIDEPPLQIEKYSSTGRRKGCIFCTIAHGEDPTTDLLYKDDDFVTFRNITPAASHHYLIIPKVHIRDGLELRPHHIPMLIRMDQIGKEVLAQQGGHLKPHRMGYHWPPFTSVYHLHLHVISAEDEMSLYSKMIFLTGSEWFRSKCHPEKLPDFTRFCIEKICKRNETARFDKMTKREKLKKSSKA